MVDVLKDNFGDTLSILKEIVPTSTFVAIDMEMTGIMPPMSHKISACDSPQDRYEKLSYPASTFKLIQFGLSVFHTNQDGACTAQSFNFYLFPDSGRLQLSASAINFLRSHNMDFNKWIYNGLNYQSRSQRAAEIEKEAEEIKPCAWKNRLSQQSNNSTEDIELIGNSRKLISNWIKENDGEELVLVSETNSYQRHLLYKLIETEFPTCVAQSRSVQGSRMKSFVIASSTLEAKQAALKSDVEARRVLAENALGFGAVYDILCNSKKPLVTHNGAMDILFMYSHLESRLPGSLEVFKDIVTSNFPVIWDTKLLAKLLPPCDLPHSDLQSLYEVCMNMPSPVITHYPELTADKYHTAGFDAYITGFSFAKLWYYLPELDTIESDSSCKFLSHIPLPKFLFNNGSLNLAGNDTLDSELTYYLVTQFATHITNHDLVKLFQVGDCKVNIFWKNEDLVIVSLNNEFAKMSLAQALSPEADFKVTVLDWKLQCNNDDQEQLESPSQKEENAKGPTKRRRIL